MGAEAADDEFAVADNALAEGAGSGCGDGVEVDVFDDAAAVADEVMMLLVFGVVASGAAFCGDLADEAGFYEVAKIVVGGGAREAWVNAVDGFVDFGCGGVFMMRHEERHDAVALRGATQAAVFESLANCFRCHRRLDYV